MRLLLSTLSWTVPALLVVSFVLYALATADDLLGALRLLLFYGVGLAGMLFAKASNVRQLRNLARAGKRPTVYLVADLYRNLTLTVLLLALLFAGVNTLLPAIPNIPDSVILGLLGSCCAAFFVIGLVQQFAGRRRLGGMEIPYGPLVLLTIGVKHDR